MSHITKVEDRSGQSMCAAIRAIVFVAEQGYSIYGDFSNDHLWTEEYLLWADGTTPVATARWKMLDERTARIGSIAVLKAHRGAGHGKAIVEYLTALVAALPQVERIQMSAQNHAPLHRITNMARFYAEFDDEFWDYSQTYLRIDPRDAAQIYFEGEKAPADALKAQWVDIDTLGALKIHAVHANILAQMMECEVD